VLARLVLAECGGEVLGGDDRADRRALGGLEDAAADAGEEGDHHQVRHGDRAEGSGGGERAVEEYAGQARAEHQLLAVDPVGDDPGRQEGAAQPEQPCRLEQGRDEARAGQVVAEQREDEHRHRRAELVDGLADPQRGEVAVAGELAIAGHIPHHMMRNIYCASVRAHLWHDGLMTSEPDPRMRHDLRILRAIAHPARSRILQELEAAGPLRAADVARLLEIPANQASFHLRQLAKYGLVEPAPEEAHDKRDRVWRLVDESRVRLDLKDITSSPGGAAAVKIWQRSAGAWAHQIVSTAYALEEIPGTFRAITEQPIRLTREEARELADELDAVLERWADRQRGAALDDGRSTHLFFAILQPHPQRTGS
jgi:DNA-binding transcriptional ArsR family regulator